MYSDRTVWALGVVLSGSAPFDITETGTHGPSCLKHRKLNELVYYKLV